MTTTTWKPGARLEDLRGSEKLLWQQLRRDFGRLIEYCGFLEWTTGWHDVRGFRRPHIHHLVKGLDVALAGEVACRASELWRRFSPDRAWQVECRPLWTPLGAIAYLVLHHHKREQGPPPGTKHTKRLRPSRGYFNRPIREYRDVAEQLLRDDRLMAELVEVFDVPDRLPSYLVEELIAERIDEARCRAAYDAPMLVNVRERCLVDTSTGEILHEFVGVMDRVPGGRPLLDRERSAVLAGGFDVVASSSQS